MVLNGTQVEKWTNGAGESTRKQAHFKWKLPKLLVSAAEWWGRRAESAGLIRRPYGKS